MKKYEIYQNTREISYKNREEIKEGCTLDQRDLEPELIKSCENKDEALDELGQKESEIVKLSGGTGTFYSVTEYFVQENDYDEEGDWIGGGDVWAFSKMPELED